MLFHPKRYKLLLEQVDAAERSIANLGEQQRQIQEDLTQQQTQYEQDVAALRETFTGQIVQMRETFTGQIAQMREIDERQRSQHESLVALINDSQHQLDRLRDNLTETLAHQEGQTQRRFQEIEAALTEQRQAVEQVHHLLSTQTERQAGTLREQRKEMEALLAQHARDVGDALQRVNQEGTADLAAFNQRFERIEAKLEQLATNGEALKSTARGWQLTADAQGKQIAALRTQLQEEVQARKALAQQVATLTAQRGTRQPRKPEA
jgi:5S rRNA maturation endonuclease (ribonuclease M5)